ncbi:MAG: hypothetical protein U1A78_34370 [Polyangia bacterium]
MRSVLILRALLVMVLLAGGCGRAMVRVNPTGSERPAGPPRIQAAVDLGALPLPPIGTLSTEHSDRLFTPGEYVALRGDNLVWQSRITLGGQPLPPLGRLADGALLVRVPRGLPAGTHTLTLDNGLGTATVALPTAHYAFGGDTQGDALRFRRLGPDAAGFAEPALDIPFARARFQALSPDGGVLYALQEPDPRIALMPSVVNTAIDVAQAARDDVAADCELLIVHLGGRGGPQKVGSVTLSLGSAPTALSMSPAGVLVVVQRRQITLLDARDPLRPRPLHSRALTGPEQPRELIDAEFFADGRLLAVLEAYANQVHLLDVTDAAQPRVLAGVSLARPQDEPFSIDLARAADGRSLWVLQGPNLKLGGKRLLDGLKATWTSAQALELRAAAVTLGQTATSAAMLPGDGVSRLVQLTLEGSELRLARAIPLPASLFPFFVLPDRDGALYVSGISRNNPFADTEATLDGVVRLLQALKNTVQLGTVLKVRSDDGAMAQVLQGVALYYDLALLPGGQLLTSTVRLGPGFIPPRLTLDWGLEIAGGPASQFTKLREVGNTALKLTGAVQRVLPPYRYERIGAQ